MLLVVGVRARPACSIRIRRQVAAHHRSGDKPCARSGDGFRRSQGKRGKFIALAAATARAVPEKFVASRLCLLDSASTPPERTRCPAPLAKPRHRANGRTRIDDLAMAQSIRHKFLHELRQHESYADPKRLTRFEHQALAAHLRQFRCIVGPHIRRARRTRVWRTTPRSCSFRAGAASGSKVIAETARRFARRALARSTRAG